MRCVRHRIEHSATAAGCGPRRNGNVVEGRIGSMVNQASGLQCFLQLGSLLGRQVRP